MSHGQRNDAMRVVSFGQGVVGHVRVEVFATTSAMMLRVGEVDVAGATGNQVSDVMQDASERAVSSATLATSRAWSMLVIVAALNDPCSGQILWFRNALGGIWRIPSWCRHSSALLGRVLPAKNLRALLLSVIANFPVMMLKTQKFHILISEHALRLGPENLLVMLLGDERLDQTAIGTHRSQWPFTAREVLLVVADIPDRFLQVGNHETGRPRPEAAPRFSDFV